ncbi:hypothetical protein [Geothrix sp. SG200]|uniref:hypothetical protein n=1 Tax=Geothrix sp. SG200 TaxID=2922865 RepID=UPI001FAE41B1|nr:hypothetical protein [Geothrix sp. SG200]
MTVLVGIRCKDGILIASDSAATFGAGGMFTIGQQQVQKVKTLGDHIIYAATGAVGISQILSNQILRLWKTNGFSGLTEPEQVMDKIGKEIAQFLNPYLHTAQYQRSLTGEAGSSICKSLVAIPVNKKPHLFQFDVNGSPEMCTKDLPFVALGSGQAIADPFLAYTKRLLWSDSEPSLSEGRLVAAWTIDHVKRTNPGGVGGGIQMAILPLPSKPGDLPTVQSASDTDIGEHLEKINAAETALINEIKGINTGTSTAIPGVPVPGSPATP